MSVDLNEYLLNVLSLDFYVFTLLFYPRKVGQR